MPIATDVSPAMVRALAVIAGAGRLYCFGAGYGRSRERPFEVALATVEALAFRGLVRTSRQSYACGAIGHADLTDAGTQRVLAGAPGIGVSSRQRTDNRRRRTEGEDQKV